METWDWPIDEGLWLNEVYADSTLNTNVYEGRGAGWLNNWELYYRFSHRIKGIEDALAIPAAVESGWLTWASAIFRFVTPV